MEKENLYGKHIYQSIPKKWRIVALGIFAAIALLFSGFLALVAVAMIFTNDVGVGIFFLVLSLPLAILIVYALATNAFLQHTVNIYEHGITLTRASKVLEFDFKDLDGISAHAYGTPIGGGVVTDIWKTRLLIIYPRQVKPIGISANNMQAVSSCLEGTYDNYVISTLTKENIKNKTIRFGKYIELNDGKIIHTYLKKEFPLESIAGIFEEDGMIILKGKNDSFPLADPQTMNFRILYYILNGTFPLNP